ncbi:hypothetical protein BDR06DRAFT_976028 [Suillus hirtellus]|nr:hypothetical protein BDR06DRAFT_976028 [Suillus hirtellus]
MGRMDGPTFRVPNPQQEEVVAERHFDEWGNFDAILPLGTAPWGSRRLQVSIGNKFLLLRVRDPVAERSSQCRHFKPINYSSLTSSHLMPCGPLREPVMVNMHRLSSSSAGQPCGPLREPVIITVHLSSSNRNAGSFSLREPSSALEVYSAATTLRYYTLLYMYGPLREPLLSRGHKILGLGSQACSRQPTQPTIHYQLRHAVGRTRMYLHNQQQPKPETNWKKIGAGVAVVACGGVFSFSSSVLAGLDSWVMGLLGIVGGFCLSKYSYECKDSEIMNIQIS